MATYDSITDYLTVNPSATRFYIPLLQGHILNTGHPWEGTVTVADGTAQLNRTCC